MKTRLSDKNSTEIIALYSQNWRQMKFWRDMFLYFWFFSLIGHVVELIWAILGVMFTLKSAGHLATIPVFAIAAPYGLGALALLILIYPLVKRQKLGLVSAYFLSVAITTIIEFISALLVVLVLGSNPFWDYSNRFMNLFGFVCLSNSLLFGVISVISIKWLFPWTEKWRSKIDETYLNLAFWVLFPSYLLVQIVRFV